MSDRRTWGPVTRPSGEVKVPELNGCILSEPPSLDLADEQVHANTLPAIDNTLPISDQVAYVADVPANDESLGFTEELEVTNA